MAGDKCLSSDSSIKMCKKCKRVPHSGPSCVVCKSSFHPSCVKQMKNIKIIDEKTVNCCLNDESHENKVMATSESDQEAQFVCYKCKG